jgi:hypothetical protein
VFALAGRIWSEARRRSLDLALAGAVLAFSMLAIPRSALDTPTLHDAPGLELARSIDVRSPVVLAVGVATVSALLALVARPRGALAAVAIASVVSGHALAWRAVSSAAREGARQVAAPRDWLDREVDGAAEVAVVEESPLPRAALRELALWNRSLGPLFSTRLTEADPRDGSLPGAPATPFVLTRVVGIAGQVLERRSLGSLVRVEPPPRLAFSTEGIYPDGWSGERAVYRRYVGPPRPGTVIVTLSRRAWTGPDVPGSIVLSAGRLGDPRPVGGIVIHSGQEQDISLAVPRPPFEVSIEVGPTFSPADFGQADTRQLGAQVRFTYRPASA